MPGGLGEMLESIQAGLGQLPPAVLVIGLLFGPTLAWVLFRFFAAPRSTRAEAELGDLFWICPECKSANEVARQRCYLCHTDREAVAGALRVVDRDLVVEIDEADVQDAPLVAVGPGRVEPAEAPSEPQVAARSAGTVVPIDEAAKRRRATRGKRPPKAVPIEPEQAEDALEPPRLITTRSRRRRPSSSEEDAAG